MRIVLIWGGSWVSNLLKTFQKDTNIQLSAIISTSDSGGSTGVLRQSYEVPALGDIRKNLSALAGEDALWTEHRFQHWFLDEHPVWNIWLLWLVEKYGFSDGLSRAHEMLGVQTNRIIPATEEIHDILVTLKNGERILWEDHIIAQTNISHNIETLELTPKVQASKMAIEALKQADMILIGPGTFYTSVIPCLLPNGILEALQNSQAKKVFVANVANFPVGHCEGYDVDTYLSEFERLLGVVHIDTILVHDMSWILSQESVGIGREDTRKIVDNFLLPATERATQGKFDSILRNTLKHDAEKVLEKIKALL
jgi:uncharacterized cofD-like protein